MKTAEFSFMFTDEDGKVIETVSGFGTIEEMSKAIIKHPTFLLDEWEYIAVKFPNGN